jgi:hypothetical protein
MIELNLTHEESKKILELGYDFKKIATDFVIDFATKFNQTKLKRVNAVMAIDSSIDTFAISGFSQNKPDCFYFIESNRIIPIIPKAALEACLPLIDGVIWKRFPAAGDGLLRCTGLNHRTVETCTGFHEFLWCHENYPEELKKKFDEVMG